MVTRHVPTDPSLAPEYTGMLRSLGQGATLGWGDEAEAWLRSKLTGQDYNQTLGKIHAEQGKFAKESPYTQTGPEFAGSLAPLVFTGGASSPATAARTAGTLGRIAENPYVRNAVIGGGTGAEEGSRTEGAVSGGVLGTGLGVAIPAALRGGKSVYDWAKNRIAPTAEAISERAAQKFRNALQTNPEELAQKMTEYGNTPAMAYNLDPGLAQLAETIAQRGGKGATELEKKIIEQKAGARERVHQNVKENLSPKNYYAEEQKLATDLRSRANSMYDKAYELGDINDPKINAILEDPHFAEFYQRAKQIADKKALAAKVAGEDPSQYQLKQIYTLENNPDGTLKGFKKTDVPDVRTLDFIKQGIDDAIESAYASGSSVSKKQAAALKDLKNAFVNRIDEVTTPSGGGISPYKAARQQYAGDAEVLDALRTGYNDFGKLDHEEVAKLISKMGDAEKEAFRTGVARNLYGTIMNPSMDSNAAKKIIGSPELRAKLQPLFDSPEKFDLFKNVMERESQLYHESNKILGGSQTAKRQQMRENFEGDTGAGEVAGDLITGGPWEALTNKAIKALGSSDLNDKTAAKLSQMLTAGTPHEVAAAVQSLEDYAAKAAPREAAMQQVERGLTLGTTAAAPPAPLAEDENRPSLDNLEKPTFTRDIEADIANSKKK
jgi:hypothetical protein